jgi:hypothetical protein
LSARPGSKLERIDRAQGVCATHVDSTTGEFWYGSGVMVVMVGPNPLRFLVLVIVSAEEPSRFVIPGGVDVGSCKRARARLVGVWLRWRVA